MLCENGHHAVASNVLREIIQARRSTLGGMHAETLSSMQDFGRSLAEEGQWPEVVEVYERLVELEPQIDVHWFILAALYLQQGTVSDYQQVCREMLNRFADSPDSTVRERTAKTCYLAAGECAALDLTRQLAEAAVRGAPDRSFRVWAQLASGLGMYRRGEFQSSIEELNDCVGQPNEFVYQTAIPLVVQAMAHHQLGHSEDARSALERAANLMATAEQPGASRLEWFWHEDLRYRLLRREAELLIGGSALEGDSQDP
jgi:hypothetical protein